jgi:hypothetical protein
LARNQLIVHRAARCLLMSLALLAGAAGARAETVVLRNGQRLAVTGYERRDDTMLLQVSGGTVEVRAGDVLAIEPEETFPALKTAPKPTLEESIRDAAARHQLDPDFVASVIAVESNFDARAVSPKNARGLMQLIPGTSERLAVQDVFDARQNLDGGVRYLRELLDRYGQNASLALAAYNAGPGRVDREAGIPSITETRRYVARVLREWRKRKAQANKGTPLQANGGRKASSSAGLTDH